MNKRRASPISKFSKTKRRFFPQNFKIYKEGVEEFKISQIIPDIKKEKLKPMHKLLNKTTKANLKNMGSFNNSERKNSIHQIKVMIHKNDESSEEESDHKMIRFEEIKVWVTPNGSRFKKNEEFDNAYGDYVNRTNSDGTNPYHYMSGKQSNFDLEQEVNYVPSSKLILPNTQVWQFTDFVNVSVNHESQKYSLWNNSERKNVNSESKYRRNLYPKKRIANAGMPIL